jgi:hypothetical protein
MRSRGRGRRRARTRAGCRRRTDLGGASIWANELWERGGVQMGEGRRPMCVRGWVE